MANNCYGISDVTPDIGCARNSEHKAICRGYTCTSGTVQGAIDFIKSDMGSYKDVSVSKIDISALTGITALGKDLDFSNFTKLRRLIIPTTVTELSAKFPQVEIDDICTSYACARLYIHEGQASTGQSGSFFNTEINLTNYPKIATFGPDLSNWKQLKSLFLSTSTSFNTKSSDTGIKTLSMKLPNVTKTTNTTGIIDMQPQQTNCEREADHKTPWCPQMAFSAGKFWGLYKEPGVLDLSAFKYLYGLKMDLSNLTLTKVITSTPNPTFNKCSGPLAITDFSPVLSPNNSVTFHTLNTYSSTNYHCKESGSWAGFDKTAVYIYPAKSITTFGPDISSFTELKTIKLNQQVTTFSPTLPSPSTRTAITIQSADDSNTALNTDYGLLSTDALELTKFKTMTTFAADLKQCESLNSLSMPSTLTNFSPKAPLPTNLTTLTLRSIPTFDSNNLVNVKNIDTIRFDIIPTDISKADTIPKTVTTLAFTTTITSISDSFDLSKFKTITNLMITSSIKNFSPNSLPPSLTSLTFTDGIPTIGSNLKATQITKIILNSSSKTVDFDVSELSAFTKATFEVDASVTNFAPKKMPSTLKTLIVDGANTKLTNMVGAKYISTITFQSSEILDFAANLSMFTGLKTLNLPHKMTTFSANLSGTPIASLTLPEELHTFSANLSGTPIASLTLPEELHTFSANLSGTPIASLTLPKSVIGFNPTALPTGFALTLNSPPTTFCTTAGCTNLTSITLNTTTITDWSTLDLSSLKDLKTIILSDDNTTFFPPSNWGGSIDATGFTRTFDFSKVSWDSVNKITISNGDGITGLILPPCPSTCSLDLKKLGIPKKPAITFMLDLTKTTPANITFNNTPVNSGQNWCYKASSQVTVGSNWVRCTASLPNIPALCTGNTDTRIKTYCDALTAINDTQFYPGANTMVTETLPKNIDSLPSAVQQAAKELVWMLQSLLTFYSHGQKYDVTTQYPLQPISSDIFCTTFAGTIETDKKICPTQYALYYFINNQPSLAKTVMADHYRHNLKPVIDTWVKTLKAKSNPFEDSTGKGLVCGIDGITNTQWSLQANFNTITKNIINIIQGYSSPS